MALLNECCEHPLTYLTVCPLYPIFSFSSPLVFGDKPSRPVGINGVGEDNGAVSHGTAFAHRFLRAIETAYGVIPCS